MGIYKELLCNPLRVLATEKNVAVSRECVQ